MKQHNDFKLGHTMYRYTGRRQLPRYVNILNLTACNLQSVDKLQPSMCTFSFSILVHKTNANLRNKGNI